MKLYDFPGAPNPKRVKIFANEKGIELELVPCDMRRGRTQITRVFEEKSQWKNTGS